MTVRNGRALIDYLKTQCVAFSILLSLTATTLNAQIPDTAKSYSNADLPDAMTFLNGRRVETIQDWNDRKAEIRKLWCDFYIGHYPHRTPELLGTKLVRATKMEDGSLRQRIVLTFDTPNKKSFEIEVWIPQGAAGKPRPLLLTQPRHYQREKWGEEALRRGYIVCVYPGLDTHHREKDYPGYESVWKTFKSEYPDATWASSLGIQAWLASRALDYLLDPEFEYPVDRQAVGITGFSRYGKQSIYAAAFDERIKCVVARSSGSPAASPYRFTGRETFMETPSDFPAPWALGSLKGYLGREHELPVACNSLIACIAPRHVLIDSAHNDGGDPTFAVERSFQNARKVWEFLGAKDNICLSYRNGNHNPIMANRVKQNLDYFDMAFGRGQVARSDFPDRLLHEFDWSEWRASQRPTDLNLPATLSIRKKVEWMLGEQPKLIEHAGEFKIKLGDELGVPDWSRDRWNPGGVKRVPFSFSGKMHGNIFFDPQRDNYKGTVIWLHPWNYSHGSNEGYGVQGTTVYYRLAKEGYKVVMYDQFGFGDHLLEAVDFYEKNPHWSRMGRAVHDVSRVVDFLVDGKGISAEPVPPTDPERIFICGFAYGGMVGLYATALDDRIAGLACFSGFTPMRSDTDSTPSGGIRRFWEWHAQIPKLGLFHGREATIPYDYEDLLALIGDRECLIYAPKRDRFADFGDVKSCVQKAIEASSHPPKLVFETPDDICRFQRPQQETLLSWLATVAQAEKN